MLWERLVKYPGLVRFNHPSSAELLDALEDLSPPEVQSDRHIILTDFLNVGKELGLLTDVEVDNLRAVTSPYR